MEDKKLPYAQAVTMYDNYMAYWFANNFESIVNDKKWHVVNLCKINIEFIKANVTKDQIGYWDQVAIELDKI